MVERGAAARQPARAPRARSRRAAGSPGAPSGIPIGATRSSPVCHLPGATRWPTLAAWKLTVTSASTATPSTSPLEASTPEAMSQATTGAPQRLIASIAAAAGLARRAREAGAEDRVDDRARARQRAPRARRRRPGSRRGSRSRFAAASPLSSSAGQSSSASTSKPISAAGARDQAVAAVVALAADDPHGPLRAPARATASATARPAASISSSEGTPCSSIAQRSTARMPRRRRPARATAPSPEPSCRAG